MPTFYCTHCGQSIKTPEELRGQSAPCPTCGNTVIIPGNSLIPNNPLKETSHSRASRRKNLKKKVIAIICFCVVVSIGFFIILPQLTYKKIIGDRIETPKKPFLVSEKYGLGLGMTYEDLTSKIKKLREDRAVEEVSIGRVTNGWRINSKCIRVSFRYGNRLDLRPSIEPYDVSFYTSGDVVEGISLNYTFKQDYRGDIFNMLVSCIKDYSGIEPSITMYEDDVGQRSRRASARKDGIVFSVTDDIDGNFSDFAPDLWIYYEKKENK